MGTLEIIRRNGEKVRLFSKEPFCTLKSAAQNSSLMGDDNVQLSIVSSELLNLGKGDKIIVEGEEYTIRTKVNREMLSDNHYVHDATFYGVMYELMKSLYRNTDANGKSSKSTFDLTYNIRDFVKVLISYIDNQDLINSIYEVASAYSTVGLSVGVSGSASTFTKILLIVFMFFGRVGIMTISVVFMTRIRKTNDIRYPECNFIVG